MAQTTCAHINHFYKAVLGALEFDGPAIVVCYTTCQPEHGVADNMAGEQARLAVDTRAFPLLIYDPRKGDTIKERLSLQGNPAVKDDWYVNPKTNEAGRLHRLRPQRRPVRQALRQGRQSVGDAAAGQAGPARELARAAGAGGPEVTGSHRRMRATSRPLAVPRTYTSRVAWTPPWNSSSGPASELRLLRMVRLWKDRLRVYDVNRDVFEIVGLGYPDPDVIPLLDRHQRRLRPGTIHLPTDAEYKEFKTRPPPSLGRGSGDVTRARCSRLLPERREKAAEGRMRVRGSQARLFARPSPPFGHPLPRCRRARAST